MLAIPEQPVGSGPAPGSAEAVALNELNTLRRRFERAFAPYEGAFYLNLAYYLGQQWFTWNAATQTFEETAPSAARKSDSWRVTRNYVYDFVRTLTGRFLKSDPVLSVRPNSPEPGDADAAALAEQVVHWWWQSRSMQKTLRELLTAVFVYGSAFVKVYYRPSGKRTITLPALDEAGAPRLDPAGAPLTLEKQLDIPEVCADVLLPFEVLPDDAADSPDLAKCRRLIVRKAFPIEEVERLYGRRVAPDASLADSPLAKLARESKLYDETPNRVTVYELWERPSDAYPDGRFIVWTESALLESRNSLPYALKDIFLVKFDDGVLSKRFWGIATVSRLREAQSDYNGLWTLVLEWLQRHGIGKWFMEANSLENKEGITDEAGQVLKLRPGFHPPGIIQHPQPPNFLLDIANRIVKDMEVAAGVFDVTTRSTPPSGVTAFRALALLSEQDETRLAPGVREFSEGLSRVARLALNLIQEFFTLPQDLRVIGEDRKVAIRRHFVGADLHHNTDVVISLTAGLGMNKATQADLILQLAEHGFFDPANPAHRAFVLKFLELPDTV